MFQNTSQYLLLLDIQFMFLRPYMVWRPDELVLYLNWKQLQGSRQQDSKSCSVSCAAIWLWKSLSFELGKINFLYLRSKIVSITYISLRDWSMKFQYHDNASVCSPLTCRPITLFLLNSQRALWDAVVIIVETHTHTSSSDQSGD